ncbi:MAG: hypothetical protein LVQ95_02595 [Candidatus Micrarchaeales archaeon]|nr:hypothetical protein [Candidatus Micrarchaeales archaeon]
MAQSLSVDGSGSGVRVNGQSKAFGLAESVCNALYENPLQRDFHTISGMSKAMGNRLIAALVKADLIERSPIGSGKMLRLSPAPMRERDEILQFLKERFMQPYGWLLRECKDGVPAGVPHHIRKCLDLKLAGYTNHEIAALHGLTQKSVETYLRFVKDPEAYKESHRLSDMTRIKRRVDAELGYIGAVVEKHGFFISDGNKMTDYLLLDALYLSSQRLGFKIAVLPAPRLLLFRLAGRLVAYRDADKLASTLAGMYDIELRRRGASKTKINAYSEVSFMRTLSRRTMTAFAKDRRTGKKVLSAIHTVLRDAEHKPFVCEGMRRRHDAV